MTNRVTGSARSYLYVPADRRDRLDGALNRGADALIVDLEDAVPLGGKDQARANLVDWLRGQRAPGCQLWVRVNSTCLELDVATAVTSEIAGIVVPKADTATLARVGELLGEREHELAIARGSVLVMALIETAAGLVSVHDIARSPRVRQLGLGEADLTAELRLQPSAERAELASLRLQLVVASAAANIGPPVGPASTDFRDLDRLRRSTLALRRLGFRARTAIHPAQVTIINEVFTATDAEVAAAHQQLAAFEAAERRGSGVLTDDAGMMIDAAVVRSAREVIERAGQPD
jgi:citrate lyase subunit beta / citryl-CoA lyase